MRRPGDFDRAVRGGVRTGKSTMVVHVADALGDEDAPSVGFVVSKAVGNAVVRNVVKRRMRAVVAEHLTELAPGTLVVVRSLPASAAASYRTLQSDFTSCLARAQKKRLAHRPVGR
jgi:ribonuclease P protein component